MLDTEQVDNPAQTTWLDETLTTPTEAAWKIVVMHKPVYSAGFHGADAKIQQQRVPTFEQFNGQFVLAGHEDFTEVSTSTLHYVDLLAEDDS